MAVERVYLSLSCISAILHCDHAIGPRPFKFTESDMITTVSQMTKSEFAEMIGTIVEQKLVELLGEPDEGLHLRKVVRDRLLRQQQAIAAGERGESFEDVVQRLGLQ